MKNIDRVTVWVNPFGQDAVQYLEPAAISGPEHPFYMVTGKHTLSGEHLFFLPTWPVDRSSLREHFVTDISDFFCAPGHVQESIDSLEAHWEKWSDKQKEFFCNICELTFQCRLAQAHNLETSAHDVQELWSRIRDRVDVYRQWQPCQFPYHPTDVSLEALPESMECEAFELRNATLERFWAFVRTLWALPLLIDYTQGAKL